MAFLGSCRRHQNQCLDKANGQHISKKIKKGSRQEFLHQAPRLVWMAICHDLPDSFGWRVHIVSIVSFVFHSDISDPFSIHALGLKMAGATCQWSLKYGESHPPLTSICRTIICIIFLGYLGVLKACATHTSKILKGGVPIHWIAFHWTGLVFEQKWPTMPHQGLRQQVSAFVLSQGSSAIRLHGVVAGSNQPLGDPAQDQFRLHGEGWLAQPTWSICSDQMIPSCQWGVIWCN